MAWTSEHLFELCELVKELPHGIYFDNNRQEKKIDFQAYDLAHVKKIRECFPGVVWKKVYQEGLEWWDYYGKFKGWEIKIYACRQPPAGCKAITEIQTVTENIPVEFEEREIKKEVIVGWDCGENNDQEIRP